MKVNYQNTLTSSFLLFLDHEVLSKGEAYSNTSSLFYPVTGVYNGYYTYAAPYKQIVNDYSLNSVDQLSGVYLDNSFVVPGQSGLVAINHYDGQVIFSSNKNSYTISGDYGIKDFNVYLTDKSEDYILFYTKIEPKSRRAIPQRGLETNEITYPAIFLSLESSTNDPFAFGGVDMTKSYFRTVVMADNLFNLDAVCGILRDTSHNFFKLVDNQDLKFNAMTAYTGTPFNYSSVATGAPIYIADVDVSRVKPLNSPDFVNLNPQVFSAIIDFELQDVRSPHSS
jgi:hypothetical protein